MLSIKCRFTDTSRLSPPKFYKRLLYGSGSRQGFRSTRASRKPNETLDAFRYRYSKMVEFGEKCRFTRRFGLSIAFAFALSATSLLRCLAEDEWKSSADLQKLVVDRFEEPKDCKLLHRENRIWINRDEQVVVLDGYVAQRAVPLELFACPAGTKEHEAIVAVFARAQLVHAGLLAINAKPGGTATFEPFKAAHGTTVRVYVLWTDADGKTNGTLAQNWIRKSGTKKSMHWDWVFAGSKIYKDDDGKEHYLGDSGELISVSNFTSSTMDVSVRSEQSNANLIFESFTERIPPRYTLVRLVLTLTDEAPFGSSDTDQVKESKEEPKFLTAKVPDSIMQLLVAKPIADPKPKATQDNPSKSPQSNSKK